MNISRKENIMKVNKINVNYGFTINLGNYSSKRIDAGVEIYLDDEDDVGKTFGNAWFIVKDQIENQKRMER